MSSIKIEKVKLKSEKLEVDYLVTLADNSHVSRSEERDTKAHPDLINALHNLSMHLAVLCDYRTVTNAKAEGLEEFIVTGYSIGGKDEGEGVVITGYKLTKRGKAVTLNTPFERLEQDEATAYYFLPGLKEDIEKLEAEVISYLNGTKKAPDPQLPLFPETKDQAATDQSEAEDHQEEEKQEEKKKRGRPRKATASE